MVADIATGHTAAADVLLLIAAIMFAVVFVVQLAATRRDAATTPAPALIPAGLCLIAIALLIW